jgi:hypothetical protein
LSPQIDQERFTTELFDLLDETFEHTHGIYLDRDTSLFDTLNTITAAEASRPVGNKCATLGAQVAHVNFYLEVLERYLITNQAVKSDWGEVWRTVSSVTPEEWAAAKVKLSETYHRVLTLFRNTDSWNGENSIGGALAMLVHTAYHLGEIRQALCTLK